MLAPRTILAAYLILSKRHPYSSIIADPYVQSLAAEAPDLPVFWPAESLRLLPTSALYQIAARRQEADQQFEACRLLFSLSRHNEAPEPPLTRLEYEWGYSHVATRSFWSSPSREEAEELSFALRSGRNLFEPLQIIPGMDMMNYQPDPSSDGLDSAMCASTVTNGEVWRAKRRLVPGEEITSHYGDFSPVEMFYNYGFLPDAKICAARLDWECGWLILDSMTDQILAHPAYNILLASRKKAILGAMNPPLRFPNGMDGMQIPTPKMWLKVKGGQVSPQTLARFRVACVVTPFELDVAVMSLKESGERERVISFLSSENEMKARQLVCQVLQLAELKELTPGENLRQQLSFYAEADASPEFSVKAEENKERRGRRAEVAARIKQHMIASLRSAIKHCEGGS